MKHIVWKDAKQQYSSKENGYLGKIKIFAVFYNACASRGECGNQYCLTPLIPGFPKERLYSDNQDDLKNLAEELLTAWLSAAGLEFKGGAP